LLIFLAYIVSQVRLSGLNVCKSYLLSQMISSTRRPLITASNVFRATGQHEFGHGKNEFRGKVMQFSCLFVPGLSSLRFSLFLYRAHVCRLDNLLAKTRLSMRSTL
jgi:hypothetical protein